jgi:hypothetical protein
MSGSGRGAWIPHAVLLAGLALITVVLAMQRWFIAGLIEPEK